MFSQRISKRELAGVGLLFILYFIILLGSRLLNVPDEGRYPDVARAMLLTGDFITPKLNGVAFFHKPILYYWLQCISYSVFGISEWSIRLMPALAAAFGCVMTYIAGTLLYSRRAGVLAAVVLAANPIYYLSSHYADMNLEVALFISCTLFCFIMALQYPFGSQRRTLMWLAYAFAALGVLTKGLIGIILPMMVIGVWIALTWQWRLLREIYLVSGMVIFLVIALPWFVVVQIKNPGFFDFFIIYQHFTRFTGSGFNNALPGWFYLPVLFLGTFPWSVPFLFSLTESFNRIWRKHKGSGVDLFLMLWVMLVIIFFSAPESKIVGYILPVVPAMALLVGAYLARLSETMQRPRALLSVTLVALLIALLMLLFVDKLPQEQIAMGIKPYYLAMALVLLIGAVVTALLAWWHHFMAAFVSVAATGSLFTFALLLMFTPVTASESIKPLALLLNARIQPGELVVNYEDYYQDLGIYLESSDYITVVSNWSDPEITKTDNWRSELYRGFPDTEGEEHWMIDKTAFTKRLATGVTVYLFTGAAYVPQLTTEYRLHVVAEANGIALLTNKSDDSAKGP